MSEGGYQDERLQPSRFGIIRWFGFDQFEPERAVTSYWVSSRVFLCIRIPFVLYSTIIIWGDIGTTAQEGTFYKFFTYFTNLTFIGLHAYLVVCICLFIQMCRSQNAECLPNLILFCADRIIPSRLLFDDQTLYTTIVL